LEANNHLVIGWESESPVPDDYKFNDYLTARNGRLCLEELDLAQLITGNGIEQELGRTLPSPLEIVYLPLIENRIDKMRRIFAKMIRELNYPGRFYYTYASKANAAEEVIRSTLKAGAHHEMSSTVDVDIALLMIERGLLTPDRFVICNGFKAAGTLYADNILKLKQKHDQLIPVIEDIGEIAPLLHSGLRFEVGLRQKTYGHHLSIEEMDAANSRFGIDIDTMWKAADYIGASPNLTLRLYHAMVGSQILDGPGFVDWLTPGIETYARLRQRHPQLTIFDFGGGMPVPMTLDFDFDYEAFVGMLLTRLQEICDRYAVPAPDVMGEFGRYTTSEHGAHLFKVITEKHNNSKLPWYIIDGSIMSSFPDSWALSEHFIVLPLNHLDGPFQRVQLGGVTCDSDDVYPPKPSQSPLYLPVETDDLYIGFFSIGAYQEMLGGVKGSKHCVLPEAYELLVERDEHGVYQFELIQGQTAQDVLRNLGYKPH
jgi:arginine decarboxylase